MKNILKCKVKNCVDMAVDYIKGRSVCKDCYIYCEYFKKFPKIEKESKGDEKKFLYPCETGSGDLIEVWRNENDELIVEVCGLSFKFLDSRIVDNFVLHGLVACEIEQLGKGKGDE
ncbi:MAG: hypothetical protein V3U78_05495 [Thiotrichaceae bacterium]